MALPPSEAARQLRASRLLGHHPVSDAFVPETEQNIYPKMDSSVLRHPELLSETDAGPSLPGKAAYKNVGCALDNRLLTSLSPPSSALENTL